MWSRSAIPYISLFYHQQTHSVHFLFMYHALYFPTFIFTLFPFLFNWSLSKAGVVNQMSHLFFEAQKYFFALFNFLKMVIFTTFVSTSINVMNLDAENNNNVSALPNVNINIELDNVDFDVVNFNVDIHNLVSTLIWHCPTSHHHITLTTLRKRSKSFLGIEEYC